ncbi:hypothetical protein OIU74_018550, partial [Salix koriyanagi]
MWSSMTLHSNLEVIRQQEAKRGSSSKSEAQDKAI